MKIWEQWRDKSEKAEDKAKAMTDRAVAAEERAKSLESTIARYGQQACGLMQVMAEADEIQRRTQVLQTKCATLARYR